MSKKKLISIIVAMGKENQIGINNKLLWHIREDLQNFKRLTLGSSIIMGRNTYESIGKPLPGRQNIILSRQANYAPQGVCVFHNLKNAMEHCLQDKSPEVFVIGGGQVYKEALPISDRIYLSRVDYSGPADTHFPSIDEQDWILHNENTNPAISTESPSWTFQELHRKELKSGLL